jgi:hypothetical protein
MEYNNWGQLLYISVIGYGFISSLLEMDAVLDTND